MNLNEMSYTPNQRNVMYREMLQPLKLKISQILLYDTEMAMEFLNEYNEIIKNANNPDVDIMSRITDLEFKIEHYEDSRGSQKKMQEQTQAILQEIEELDLKNYQLSIEEFEEAFSTLREKYNELEYYDFRERDIIEGKFHELQVKFISRLLQEKQYIGLENVIQEQDKNGLSIAINGKINQFMQSGDLKEKNKAQKIRNAFMRNNETLYSRAMWQLLYELETGKTRASEANIIDSSLSTSNALTVAPRRQTLNPFQKISRLFSKEPQLPLQVRDLKKINIEWLANHIPQQMLEESERKKIQAEGKSTNKVFIPDARTPIYDMFAFKTENAPVSKVEKGNYDSWNRNITLVKKTRALVYKHVIDGIEKTFIIEKLYFYTEDGKRDYIVGDWPNLKIISGREEFTKRFYGDTELENIINYAQLIDKALGTDWTGSLLNEIEEIAVRQNKCNIDLRDAPANSIYVNLNLSYYRMKEEYEATRLDFRGSEDARRTRFYKRFSFGEQPRELKKKISTPEPKVQRHIKPNLEEEEDIEH